MENPLEKIIDWYSSIPVSHREDIGFFIVKCNMGFESISVDTDEKFYEKIIDKLLSIKDNKMLASGLALSLQSQIYTFFISSRSTNQDWEKTTAEIKDFKRNFELKQNHSLAEKMGNKLEKLEFEKRQWIETCKNWKHLEENYLSQSYIEQWFKIDS